MAIFLSMDKQLEHQGTIHRKVYGGRSGPVPPGALFYWGDAMKEIPLTRSMVALVDDEDFEWLSQWKWCVSPSGSGIPYAVRGPTVSEKKDGRKSLISMHRVIMQTPNGLQTDHINHNTLDNRRSNLRIVNSSQNHHNMRCGCRGNSRFKGVYWYSDKRKWVAGIRVDKKQIHISCFDDEVEAAKAYDEKAREFFGEFACTNFST